MSVVAVIVARGGSRRIPRKALAAFGDTTLIGHAVRRLWDVEGVTDVVVGSDDMEILVEAERHDATTILRDAYHCDEARCSANEMLADMGRRVESLGDTVLWAHPTNPLVRSSTYAEALVRYTVTSAAGDCDSLVSVSKVQRHAWARASCLDGLGTFGGMAARRPSPLNFNPSAKRHQTAAQLEPIYFQDGAIFIQPTRQLIDIGYFYGPRPMLFEIDAVEGTDIDTPQDLAVARALWSVRHEVLP